MKHWATLLAGVAFASPSLSYLRYQRPVQASGAGQHYLTVDDTVWKHARPDLGDLRLYAGQTETAYALVVERGDQQRQRTPLSVLQQASVGGKTQFLIDMSSLAGYDHVNLELGAKDFVAHARVEGSEDLHGKRWASLGDSILYDLSKDHLGSSSTLRLPRASYKYLRITLDGAVKPRDVVGATSEVAEDQPPVWRDLSSAPKQEQAGKDTILSFDVAEKVPVERVIFMVDRNQPNFERKVEVQNENGGWIGSGEIARIHMVRGGQRIDSEDQEVAFSTDEQKVIKIRIHNGDDPPLRLTGAKLQQRERRLYFDPPSQGRLTLYYGDDKLEPPVYDYAKLFLRDKAAISTDPGPETVNPEYLGRPDDRPWSERHPAIVWVAITVAVFILGGVALRSMRRASRVST